MNSISTFVFASAAAVVTSAVRSRHGPGLLRMAHTAATSPTHIKVRVGNRMTLAAKQWGPDDGFPVLAIHGWLDNASSFDVVAQDLSGAGFRVVAVDMPGHGESSHRGPDTFYHLIDNVADVCAFVDELGWDKFTVIGHSLGGSVGCFMAATWPERVAGLVMIESLGPFTTAAKDLPSSLAASIAKRSHRPARIHQSLEDAAVANSQGMLRVPLPASRIMVRRGVKKKDDGYIWRADPKLRARSRLPMTEEIVESFLKAVKCPTLVVTAHDGLRLVQGDELIRQRLGLMEKAKHIELESGGHHIHITEAESVVAPTKSFLRSLL